MIQDHNQIAENIVKDIGAEDSIFFTSPSYYTAIIGADHKGRVVYDYNLMIDYLVNYEEMTEEEAEDFISYNTIRSLDYCSEYNSPIILYPIIEMNND